MVLACLLHDISTIGFIRGDHGYWGAQLVEPYVDEEVTWAIRAHQVLRFYPDESVGYEYPQSYIKTFGADYRPDPYIEEDYKRMRKHKWYMSGRMITVHDIYSFDPNVQCRAGGVHRHYRPQLPAAGGRARLRQQPGRAYVARDDPAGEISVGRSEAAQSRNGRPLRRPFPLPQLRDRGPAAISRRNSRCIAGTSRSDKDTPEAVRNRPAPVHNTRKGNSHRAEQTPRNRPRSRGRTSQARGRPQPRG